MVGFGVLGEEFGDAGGRDGVCEQPALAGVASGVAEFVKLGCLFDAFGDDPEVEVVSDTDNGADHDPPLIGALLVELVDERPIDLEEVNGEGVQIRERRVAGTEVVDRDFHSETLERIEALVNMSRVGQQRTLSELENETAWRKPGVAQRTFDIGNEMVVVQLM